MAAVLLFSRWLSVLALWRFRLLICVLLGDLTYSLVTPAGGGSGFSCLTLCWWSVGGAGELAPVLCSASACSVVSLSQSEMPVQCHSDWTSSSARPLSRWWKVKGECSSQIFRRLLKTFSMNSQMNKYCPRSRWVLMGGMQGPDLEGHHAVEAHFPSPWWYGWWL